MAKELELAIKIGGKLDKSLGSAVNNAQKQLDSIAKTTNKAMAATTMAVAAAGTKLVVDGVNTYKGYQSALNSAAATAGIERGTAEYEAMNAAARAAGRTTVKTAEESANALEYMALAGWNVTDSTKALMPVLKLSAATGAELATTSDLVTDSMANLGLGINDLNHYLDVAATANNKSNQTAMQLQEAYLGVGGVLKNLNSPIEESAAVLGVLANRGTKGSEAGTALNAILVNMQKKSGDAYKAMSKLGVSMYDSRGKARSIIDVFQEISNKTSKMTEENRNLMYQMIGGKSHLDSFAKIMQGFTTDTADGTKEVYSLVQAFQNCDGALDKLYDIKTDTLEGSLATLNSAFDDMKISIGEKIAPTLNGAVKNLTDKIPQIETIVVGTLERIIPPAEKVLNYLVNNSDKAIAGAIGIAKAFIAIKIGSSAIRDINSTVTIFTNLSKIAGKAGLAKTLTGVIGSLTGVSTAAGTAGGAVTAFASGLVMVVGPMSAVVAGAIGLGIALAKVYKYIENKKYNYAEGMNEQANAIGKATENLVKYNNVALEVSKQREIINNPESSTAQIANAKAKLQEIANMLGEEYNLVIHADTSSLDNAISKAQALSRTELIEASQPFLEKVSKDAAQYKTDKADLPDLQKQQYVLEEQQMAYSNLTDQVKYYYSELQNGNVTSQQYINTMNDLYQAAKQYGYENGTLGDTITDWIGASNFANAMSGYLSTTNEDLSDINERIIQINNNAKEIEEDAQKAGTYLTQALASDTQTGNALSIDTDIQKITQLGSAMVEAGISTQQLGTRFAAAKSGYTDFVLAIGDGKAQEMAQSFIDYEQSIGATTETAVQGAALIANGFQNVEAATAKGEEAINAVIANMKSLGDMQGIFNGLDSNGIADKLSDMAREMDLIPENKTISIDANGDFAVIEKVVEATQNIDDTNAIVGVIANDYASETITDVQNAVNTLNDSKPSPEITADDRASWIIQSVESKLKHLDGQKATTTIVTEYKTIGTPPGESAKGQRNWRGGLTYVNDQNIQDPREVIEYNGMRYWYEGKNILANVPKGARIYTAAQSREFIDGSHKNGLARVPFDGYIAELHAGEQVLTADEADEYSGGSVVDLIRRLREVQRGGGQSRESSDGSSGDRFVYAPNINISGNADEDTVVSALKISYSDFKEMMERYERDKRRKQFKSA